MFRRLSLLCIALGCGSTAWAQSAAPRATAKAASDAYYSGDLRKAQDLAAKAVEAAGRDDMGALNPLATLGAASEKLKDYAAAERHYRALLATMERLFGRDTINAAFGMEALARVLLKRGMVDDAEALFKRVVRSRQVMIVQGQDAFGLRHDSMRSHLALARGDWRTAYEGFQRVIERLGRDGPVNTPDHLEGLAGEANIATFVGLARAAWNLQKASGSDAGALADATFKSVQWRWRTEAGEAVLLASERAGAASAEQAGLVRRRQDQDERLKSLKDEREALTQAWSTKRDGDPAYRALAERQKAADVAAASADKFPRLMQEMVDISTRLVEAQRRCPVTRTAQCAAEIEKLQSRNAAIRQELNQAMPANYYQQLRTLETAIPGYAEFERESARLDTQIRELEGKRPASGPIPAATLPQKAPPDLLPLTISEVQSLLSPAEALITFLIGRDGVFVWVVTQRQNAWSSLATDETELNDLVHALRCGLDGTAWERGDARDRCVTLLKGSPPLREPIDIDRLAEHPPFDLERAHRLYKALLGPVQELIKDKHLLIVPSGPLTQLPLHALVTRPPASGDYRVAAWLARDHAVTVLPAVSSLKALRRVGRPSAAPRPMIGFGNPLLAGLPGDAEDAEGAKLAQAKQRCPEAVPELLAARAAVRGGTARVETHAGLAVVAQLKSQTPLPETADELCAVAQAVKAEPSGIHLGAQATERRIKRLNASGELDKYRMVHFATHGVLAGELTGTREPGLILTPPAVASDEDDGYLSASEIAGLKLDADWVVLSACNTAAGGAASAEALSGLARAFFYAQARALLVSHWAVKSNATVALITGAVGAIARDAKVGRAEALRRAMLALIDRGDPETAHPATWAPFVVVGEGASSR